MLTRREFVGTAAAGAAAAAFAPAAFAKNVDQPAACGLSEIWLKQRRENEAKSKFET